MNVKAVLLKFTGAGTEAARASIADLEARYGKRTDAIKALDDREAALLADVVALDASGSELETIPQRRASLAAEAGALLRALDSARQALAEAEAGDVRDALAAELRPIEAADAAGVKNIEKGLALLSEGLSVAAAHRTAGNAIKARLGLPEAGPLALHDILRAQTERLREKHGDEHGKGIGGHDIEIPTYRAEVNAPTAKALGIV